MLLNELKYGYGEIIKTIDEQNCLSCMQHSTLSCFINLPSTIEIILMVVELCSRNALKL